MAWKEPERLLSYMEGPSRNKILNFNYIKHVRSGAACALAVLTYQITHEKGIVRLGRVGQHCYFLNSLYPPICTVHGAL